ncbi:MAG: NUDIX hydrolase [Clostridia bacterium]|nr:NUDIX hydrolase [Clostridia bacterium]
MRKVNDKGQTLEEFLAAYNPRDYERPSVTVDIMVLAMSKELDRLRVLLIRRKNHPCIDCWAIPGGFIDIDESAYHAALRELKEETNLTDVYMEQLYTMSQPDRDPRMRVIDLAYMALLPFGSNAVNQVKAGDDAADALWFDVTFTNNELTLRNEERNITISYDLEEKHFKNGVITVRNYIPVLKSEEAVAFDHSEILLEGLMRLRNKVEYSDVAFNLVDKKFTLADLQKVYEVILGKKLYKTNFKEKINHKIVAHDEKGTSITGKKKAQLYSYKGGVK